MGQMAVASIFIVKIVKMNRFESLLHRYLMIGMPLVGYVNPIK